MRIRTLIFLLFTLLSISVQARKKNAPERVLVQKNVDHHKETDHTLSENDRRVSDYYFQEALILRQQGKFDAAFDLFRYCLALDSLNAQVWYETAVFYTNLKRPDLALEAMEKAFSLDKSNDWYTFGLANMYLTLNTIPKAIVLYESLMKSRSDDENLKYQLAGLYSQTENYKAAIRTYDQLERLIGKNESVSYEKYKLYKKMGDFNKAIHEIVTLCSKFPYDVDYVLLLGDAWMDLDNPKKAIVQYEAALAMDHTNPAVSLSMADYYTAIGDTMAAQKQLYLALTNPNTDVETKLNIFTPLLTSSMETADSVKIPGYFDVLLEQHPNDYQIRTLHVQWLLKRGKKQEAKDELRTVLDLNPNQLQAWRNYLELNAEADNQLEMRKICTNAINYFPKEPIFWFYLGLSWLSENDEETKNPENQRSAIEAFQKAVEVSKPEDVGFISRMYGLIGDSYLVLKEKVLAFDFYEKALTFHPGNILVLNNYAYYLSEDGGDLAKAERMSRKTIEAEPKNSTYLDTFAWIFFKEAKYGLAKIYIERAIANEPEPSSVVLEHYGDILWFSGEQDAARVQWKKAVKLQDPSETLLQKVETGNYVIVQ